VLTGIALIRTCRGA